MSSAKAVLAATPLSQCLPSNALVSITTGCRMEAAVQTLNNSKVLSVPVMAKGEYHGCISVNDVLKNLMLALNARKAHWIDGGAAAFTGEELVAVGKDLLGKAVGELDHTGALVLLSAGTNTSMLDVVLNSFEIRDNHHVHHRVYVAMPAGSAHTVADGSTTVVNATLNRPTSGKLTVTHVVSHLDVVRLLGASKASLGDLAGQSLEQLGLDEGAVFCVPATTPALEAFARMAADEKSSLGLTDPATGKLVGVLAASDLRGLTSPEAFSSLLSSAAEYHAAQHGGEVTARLGTVSSATTFGELLDMLVARSLHRVYVVDGEGKPTSIVTLTDVLRLASA